MIELEERLSTGLATVGDGVAHRRVDLERPRTLARRRRRNRRIRWSAAMVVLAVVGVGTILRLAPSTFGVESVDRIEFDEQGIPVDTGPELEWRVLGEADDLGLDEIVWSGRYFIGQGGEPGDLGLYRSTDGLDWERLDDPDLEELHDPGLIVGDDRLVVWSRDGDVGLGSAMLVSFDHGSTWAPFGDEIPALVDDDPTDLVDAENAVLGVAVHGDVVVALVNQWLYPDVAQALRNQGQTVADDEVVITGIIVFGEDGMVEVPYCLTTIGCADSESNTIELFIPEATEAFEPGFGPSSLLVSRDGGPFDVAVDIDSDLEGEGMALTAAGGRIVVTVWGETGPMGFLVSDDGLTWQLEPDTDVGLLLASWGSIMTSHASGPDGVEYRVSEDGGRTWFTVDLPVDPFDAPELGPAGHLVGPERVVERNRGVLGEVINWVVGESEPQPTVIGWSADGEHWGWQEVGDAFGSYGWGEFAVGDDQVIALFDHQGDDRSQRTVYVADVPESD